MQTMTDDDKTIYELKKSWRREFKSELEACSYSYRFDAGGAIRSRLFHTEEYRKSQTVMLYVSSGYEVTTLPTMAAAIQHGKRVCLPLCMDIDAEGNRLEVEHRMEARLWNAEYKLVPGAFGIPTPRPDAPLISPEEIDLVVLPCVGCDIECNRLGHGAGYYDRYMTALRDDCARMALCYEKTLTEKLPVGSNDIAVDAVITEKNIYRRK